MSAAPFRRPPMVDIPWGERERWWTRTTRRLAERPLWGAAESLADLGELVAQFCEGRLLETPGHCGPRDPETVGIAAPLAHANRQGFVTTGSQPGHDHRECEQRAAVDGWATPDTVDKLRGLVAGTRLRMQVVTDRPRRSRYDHVVNVSRSHTPDGVWEHTHFGFTPGTREHFIDLGRSDLTEGACYVTIYDPQWGDESLLWDRLSQPDWDHPEPPPPPSRAEVDDAEREADRLTREGRSAAEIDAADDETERLHQARTAAESYTPRRRTFHSPRVRTCPRCGGAIEDWEARCLRCGHDTHPTTTTTSSPGGAVSSSIEEVRAGIAAANEKATEGLGALQQAHASLEEAQACLMRTVEGSGQADCADALGLLAQAVAGVEEDRQQVSAAISASEGAAGRL